MGCLLALLALIAPRILIIILFFFTTYLHTAYQNVPVFWPILGFVFLPLTTLAYAFAINAHGAVDGIYLVIIIVAVVIDLGAVGGGTRVRRSDR